MQLEEIREYYKKLNDAKISDLAFNSSGLKEDVIPILIQEIKDRKLDDNLIKWINYSINTFEGSEKELMVEKIKNSNCSECQINSNLNGYEFNTIVSALILITDKTEFKIICHTCAKRKRFKSILTTLILGWWSEKGFLSTPFVLISDFIKIFRKNHESDIIIHKFISDNTGTLRFLNDEKMDLTNLLTKYNKASSHNE